MWWDILSPFVFEDASQYLHVMESCSTESGYIIVLFQNLTASSWMKSFLRRKPNLAPKLVERP